MIPMTCSNLSANNWICFLNLFQVEYICDQHLAGENWFLFTWLHVFLWERLLLHLISFIVLSSSSINFFHLVLMMYLQSDVQSASWTWLGFFLQYNDTLFKRVGHNLITYRMYITQIYMAAQALIQMIKSCTSYQNSRNTPNVIHF